MSTRPAACAAPAHRYTLGVDRKFPAAVCDAVRVYDALIARGVRGCASAPACELLGVPRRDLGWPGGRRGRGALGLPAGQPGSAAGCTCEPTVGVFVVVETVRQRRRSN